MDLTPQLFRDVQFTERKGAYDKDEVHAFLARVGTAVGQMQERVRDAHGRATAAEEQVARLQAAANEHTDADETLRRTLVLAQRTADAAIKEAQEEAEVIVAEARQKADDMVVQAEEAIRRDVGATRDRLLDQIHQLEHDREALIDRLAVIGEHLDSERTRLHAELDSLKQFLDDPSRSSVHPIPGSDPTIGVAAALDTAAEQSAGSDQPAGSGQPASSDDDVASAQRGPVDVTSGSDASDIDDLSALPPPPLDWDEPARDSDTSRPLFDDDGPTTEAHPIVSPGSAFGGTHLDELRRAVSDETAATEEDSAMAAFFDQDTDDDPGRRFGRRR